MLFGISERENSDPLPSEGRAEGIPVQEQDTFQQHHLQGSARIPDRLSLPSQHPEQPLLLPAPSPGWWLNSHCQFFLTWISALLWLTRAQEQHKSRALRGGRMGISWWHCTQNQPQLSPASPGDEKTPGSCKGTESTNSCNPLTCPLKAATSQQLI